MDSVGSAGGIVLLWDAHKIQVVRSWVGCFFVDAVIKNLDQGHQWMITNVYGPVQHARRKEF